MKRSAIQRKTPLKRRAKPRRTLPMDCSKPMPLLPKPRKPLPKVSARGKARNAEYAKLRKLFLEVHPICEAKYMVCTGLARHVHHKSGRGKNLNNVATWMACCPQCHDEIHQHPREARRLGYLVTMKHP